MSDSQARATRPQKIAPEQIVTALERWLPTQVDGAKVVISDLVAPRGNGFSNQTVLFTASWNNAAHQLVLQAAPAGTGLFARYDFASMARAQQRVAATSKVPVPTVRWSESDPAILGVPFYVMDRAAGRAPTDKPPYHRGSWFSDLAASDQTHIWWSGVDAMAKLHALDVQRDEFLFMQNTPWGMPLDADPALTRIVQWRKFLSWADAEPAPMISAALDELDRTRPAPRGPLRVHWGDAKLSNCMVDSTGVRALLDWELCGLSVPEEDLTHWLMLDWSLSAVTESPRLPSLPTPAQTIARYEELTGRATTDTLWWWRFGMVRLAVIYHRIMSLQRQRGRVAPDKKLTDVNPMVRFIDPVFEKDAIS